MPPTTAATTSSSSSASTNPNTLVHDCLIGAGSSSNFCLTAEVHTYDQEKHQQSATAAAAATANNSPPPPTTTTEQQQQQPQQAAANNNPAPPPTAAAAATTTTEQQQQQQQQQDCPTYKPQSGSQCGGWIPTGATARNCMYGDNRCDCDGYGRSEASSIIWICDGDLFVAPLVTINAELSSTVIAPTVPADTDPVIPSRADTIQIPTPINGAHCPQSMPTNGSVCHWVNTNKFSSYQCGYLTGGATVPGTLIMVCKCDATDTFVCAPAVDEIYQGVQSSSSF